ncbi:MAG TPA: glucose 1-dehydrogenase [Burkholderiaceae bacterium]
MDISAATLRGQVALVTGAASGIGAGVVQALAAAGAAVGINHRSRAQSADDAVARIGRTGGRALALRADVSIESDVMAMFDRLVDAFGRVDIVVANAGIQRDAAFADMTLAQWNDVLATNLTGQFLCAREAVRRFVAQGDAPASCARGKIICVSSVHDRIPWAGHVNYAASKAGVDMMMRSIAQEVAPLRIRVNAVAPGAIKTDINAAAWRTSQAEAELLDLIPYGRVGVVDDVARAVAWLASDASDYVTGTTLVVDGGMMLYPAFARGG